MLGFLCQFNLCTEQVYKSLVRPSIDYAWSVRDPYITIAIQAKSINLNGLTKLTNKNIAIIKKRQTYLSHP